MKWILYHHHVFFICRPSASQHLWRGLFVYKQYITNLFSLTLGTCFLQLMHLGNTSYGLWCRREGCLYEGRKTLEGGTNFRWVCMQKFRSLWCPEVEKDREEIKNCGRQKQKYNLLSLLALIITFQHNSRNNQIVVKPNEMVGLYCCG